LDTEQAHEEQEPKAHLAQVAAALAPLRASDSRTALAQAVARLVSGVAVVCRIDLLEEQDGGFAELVALTRMVRPADRDLGDPASDLGLDEARRGRAAVLADPRRGLSWVVLPLVAHRTLIGALRVALDSSQVLSAVNLAHLHHIAASLAMGLSSAELHEQTERVSRSLQQSLLPHQLPRAPWFKIAARYVPATAGMHVGGDWYDAELLGTSELAFSVGDVEGHGVEAAARMGELRTASHAFRMLSRTPEALIALLHRLCDSAGYFATAVCARLDPSGDLRWASAGHLPAMRVHAGGEVETLSGFQSPPLGAGAPSPVLLNHGKLAPGDTVLLYTDGLIERRDEGLDCSIERLAAQLTSLATSKPQPGELLDALLRDRQASGPTGDDIAMIAVHLSTVE
jgi:serine phosphatase RsbU (regulator of sigma subunit)